MFSADEKSLDILSREKKQIFNLDERIYTNIRPMEKKQTFCTDERKIRYQADGEKPLVIADEW